MLLIVCNRINIKKLADLRNLLSSNNFRIINNASLQLEVQRKNFSIINKQFADSWEANEGQPAEQAR
jgi:hypothetical protein